MASASATVRTLSSVNLERGAKSRKSLDRWLFHSYTEPTMSPTTAPSIALRQLRLRDLRVLGQRLQELDEVRDLGGRQVGLLQVDLVEERIVRAAADHELHGLLEGRDAAVVEVGGRPRHVAQRRRLERAGVLVEVRHLLAADVGGLAVLQTDADVVELEVREEEPDVAVRALGLLEDGPSALPGLAHRFRVAF